MKAHRTDGVSLTFALLFLGITAWWLVAQILDLALPALGWIVAGALILLGVLGLLGALRSGRGGAPAPATAPPDGSVPASGPAGATGSPWPADDLDRTVTGFDRPVDDRYDEVAESTSPPVWPVTAPPAADGPTGPADSPGWHPGSGDDRP